MTKDPVHDSPSIIAEAQGIDLFNILGGLACVRVPQSEFPAKTLALLMSFGFVQISADGIVTLSEAGTEYLNDVCRRIDELGSAMAGLPPSHAEG